MSYKENLVIVTWALKVQETKSYLKATFIKIAIAQLNRVNLTTLK